MGWCGEQAVKFIKVLSHAKKFFPIWSLYLICGALIFFVVLALLPPGSVHISFLFVTRKLL